MMNDKSYNNTALLIIDMINDFNYSDGPELYEKSLLASHKILSLKKIAKEKSIPIIYINDNFGKWKSDFNILINHCINDNTLGEEIAKILKPDKEDYFVLKPKHSAFYLTTLDLLLKYLHIETLIITGIRTESCILSSAIDASIRDYQVIIPRDCVADTSEFPEMVLNILRENFKAKIIESDEVR